MASPRPSAVSKSSPPPRALQYGFGATSIAAFVLALSTDGVEAILIRERLDKSALVAELQRRFPNMRVTYDRAATEAAIDAVTAFIENPKKNIALPLVIHGTEFQRRVWDAVLKIPFGETTTFAEIARRVGSPRAVRAVGSACTRNPLEFAIPCHRVLRTDGAYAGGSPWGDRRQKAIVEREARSHGTVRKARRTKTR